MLKQIRKKSTRRVLQGLAILAGLYLVTQPDTITKIIGYVTIVIDGILFFQLDK